MLNKQQYDREFYHLISSLKKAVDKNNEVIFFKTTKNYSKILDLLLREGFILSYQKYLTFIVIRLKTYGSNKNFKNIKPFVSLEFAIRLNKKNYTISLYELTKLQQREGGLTYYILNTDKGLLTSFDAINKRVGGKILLKIT